MTTSYKGCTHCGGTTLPIPQQYGPDEMKCVNCGRTDSKAAEPMYVNEATGRKLGQPSARRGQTLKASTELRNRWGGGKRRR